MLVLLTGPLNLPTLYETASVTSASMSSSVGFGTTVVLAVALTVMALVTVARLAVAVLPRLVQGLVVVGSVFLAAGVVVSVIALIQILHEVLGPG